MKIKYLKTHQSVEFGKGRRLENSFLAGEYHGTSYIANMAKVQFEERSNGILIYNDDDVILVGWPNIQWVKYDLATFKPTEQKKAK